MANLKTRVALKIDTSVNWASSSLVLMAGELGIESDTRKFKIGDGVNTFANLQYAVADASAADEFMKIATYDTNADGAVDKADSIKSGEAYISVNDSDTTGLWTAAKVSAELAKYIPLTEKGVASGVATLDGQGKVPASQLPSYVDDVVEAENFEALPETGESSKIYVTLDTNKTYRWGGTAYVEISASIALGETEGTAYEGNKGAANAAAIAQLQTDLDALEANVDELGALAYKDTVAEADIDNGAVTTNKIADANVTEAKLADGSVTNAKIVSMNVNKLTQEAGEYLILNCGNSTEE